MRVAIRSLVLLGLLLTSAAGLAAPQDANPESAYVHSGFDPAMLDNGTPKAQRLKLFAHVVELADQGQVRAQDLAGTLYWQGSKTPGSPVAQNLDQARKMLANAAIHGDVLAMAKLGELELGAGRPLQAMIWAQMYARYLDPMALQRSQRGQRSAYAADLIQRILNAGGKVDATVSKDVASMVQRFDTSIRRGGEAFDAQRRHAETHLIRRPMGNDTIQQANLNGVAEYMVAFDPSGRPGKVWLLAAYPNAEMDQVLRGYIDRALANTKPVGTGTRYLRVPITHNARKYQSLRPAH